MFEHLDIYLSIVFHQGKTIHFIDKVIEQRFQENTIGVCNIAWRFFEIALFIFAIGTIHNFVGNGEFTEAYKENFSGYCLFLVACFALYLCCTYFTYQIALEWQNKKLDSDKVTV